MPGDVFFGEPGGLPLLLGKKRGLVVQMRRLRVVRFGVSYYAICSRRRGEFHGQNVAVAAAGYIFAVRLGAITDDAKRAEIVRQPADGHIQAATPQPVDLAPG